MGRAAVGLERVVDYAVHDDLLLRLGSYRHAFDSYYLAIDSAYADQETIEQRVAHLLGQWLDRLDALAPHQTVFLPFDFSDQCTAWLRVERRAGTRVEVQAGWSSVPGWSIYPSHFAESGPPDTFEPINNAAIECEMDDLIMAISDNREAFAGELPEHVRRNREAWDSTFSPGFVARARKQWTADPHWGLWEVPQTELAVLPSDLEGKDVIELGCGTAYVCSWIALAGGRPVGIDNSERQLAAARALQAEFGIDFPLVHGNAEEVPYPDGSFDVAISEHGASSWCDPYRWIPEAARLLRPGGELIFMRNSDLLTLCSPDDGPAGTSLARPQFGLSQMDNPGGGVTFPLPHGPMIRLLRDSGFVVEDLIEVWPAGNSPTDFDYVDLDWARQWPSEEVWKARRID